MRLVSQTAMKTPANVSALAPKEEWYLETYITAVASKHISRRGVIVQIGGFDPLLFILMFLVFLTVFLAYGYSRGLLWFQQDSAKRADNWLVTFESRDAASGGWFRRFGRPVLVLFFIRLISYWVVTNPIVLSPFQFFIFVFVFYLPSGIVLVIILTAILWRIHKQPVTRENEALGPTDESVH